MENKNYSHLLESSDILHTSHIYNYMNSIYIYMCEHIYTHMHAHTQIHTLEFSNLMFTPRLELMPKLMGPSTR